MNDLAFDPEGYPAIKPPWGTLNAVDLNTGGIKWKVPLGEYPELTARRIPPTGTENYGGPVVTAGGLLFNGTSADENSAWKLSGSQKTHCTAGRAKTRDCRCFSQSLSSAI